MTVNEFSEQFFKTSLVPYNSMRSRSICRFPSCSNSIVTLLQPHAVNQLTWRFSLDLHRSQWHCSAMSQSLRPMSCKVLPCNADQIGLQSKSVDSSHVSVMHLCKHKVFHNLFTLPEHFSEEECRVYREILYTKPNNLCGQVIKARCEKVLPIVLRKCNPNFFLWSSYIIIWPTCEAWCEKLPIS